MSEHRKDEELLPCPFCGDVPQLPGGDGTQYEIECVGCGQAMASVQICDLMTIEERAEESFSNYRYQEQYVERARIEATKRWNERASLPVGVPDGYALVPKRMSLSPADIAAIMFQCGGDEDAEEFEDRFNGGVLWVGETLDDDGSKSYGLNIACVECLEEGSTPVVEFSPPNMLAAPTVKAEQVDCLYCQGHGDVTRTSGQTAESYSEHNEECPECKGTGLSPSLPAAGSAVEEVGALKSHLSEAVELLAEAKALIPDFGGRARMDAWRKRLPEFIKRIGYEEKQSPTKQSGGTFCRVCGTKLCVKGVCTIYCPNRDCGVPGRGTKALTKPQLERLEAGLPVFDAALSAQQSSPERVGVPVELLETTVAVLESAEERSAAEELRALLNGGEA